MDCFSGDSRARVALTANRNRIQRQGDGCQVDAAKVNKNAIFSRFRARLTGASIDFERGAPLWMVSFTGAAHTTDRKRRWLRWDRSAEELRSTLEDGDPRVFDQAKINRAWCEQEAKIGCRIQ